ncbi:OLC1v1010689C1 [Oldenlandia corymbosa var. corymbosa]|uniref:OLC1v1010689C1 n=1 Tax=Oldenlandia corymbosa var. corymbosa TaxID=529605 RepID=A0AAV1DRX6_OLDCO|nr:OLC1v1010689C1 [Oldenlandia corymbosa var. corymbosa]
MPNGSEYRVLKQENKREAKLMEEGDDARREAAIAASECLQPNFVPKSKQITSAHLSKLRELHRRRLQIKSKSQTKKKVKGNGKSNEKSVNVGRLATSSDPDNSSVSGSCSSLKGESPSIPPASTPKRMKLHWGLDTKERWEMKANM